MVSRCEPSPSKTLGLYGRRLQQGKDPAARGRRYGRPCSFVDPTSADVVIVGRRSGNQDQLVPMDGEEFCLAGRLAAFNVSALNKDAVVRYIRTQDAHHKKMDYKSELIALFKKTRRTIRPEICF
jgi:hypothetical protein